MARLPQPGGDAGDWGTILNDFLTQAHNTNGTLKNNTVTSAMLANNAVQTANIADDAVTEAKLSSAVRTKLNQTGVTDPSMGGDLTGTASNAQLAAGVVGSTELASSSVSTAKIADGSVTEIKLNTFLADKINNAGIIADDSIVAAKLKTGSGTNGQALVLDSTAAGGFKWDTVSQGSATPSGAAGGSLAGTYPNPTLAANVVASATIANGAVTLPKLATTGATNGQVISYNGTNIVWSTPSTGVTDPAVGGDLSGTASNAQIVAGAVGATELASNAVQTVKITDNAVTTTKVADANITTAKIADNNVTTTKLADNAVTTVKIADSNVTTAKIANASVTAAKISATGASNGQVLSYDGTSVAWTTPNSGGGGAVTVDNLPAGSVLYARYNTGTSTWPARPTARTDIMVHWVGGDESNAPSGAVSGVDLWDWIGS